MEHGCVGSCQSASPLGQGSPLAPPFSVTVASKRVEQGCCQSCQSNISSEAGESFDPISVTVAWKRVERGCCQSCQSNISTEAGESFDPTFQCHCGLEKSGMWVLPMPLINISVEAWHLVSLLLRNKWSVVCIQSCQSTSPRRQGSPLAHPSVTPLLHKEWSERAAKAVSQHLH